MFDAWWKTGMDMAMLSLESQGVIAQRMVVFAMGGPAAQWEAQQMVSEKVFAAGEASIQIATGATHGDVIDGYRAKVRANLMRLENTAGA